MSGVSHVKGNNIYDSKQKVKNIQWHNNMWLCGNMNYVT